MAGTLAGITIGVAAWLHSAFLGNQQQPLATASFVADLRASLSPNASVLLPGSAEFTAATARWQAWHSPSFSTIVEVATESDIGHSIRTANAHEQPFLAISGAHGGTKSLSVMQGGLGIFLRGLNSVAIAADGRTATIGGGALSGEVARALDDAGKQSTLGGCECTGFVAPMLGGGHGWLQGRYGLMADNLVSARLTLANATTITVSETEHADLFWALRGAGHNFGVVSEFEYRVYDRTPESEQWSYEMMVFPQEKLERLYEEAERVRRAGEREVELVHWSYWMRNPQIDPVKHIIIFYVIYQGAAVPEAYTAPFHALQPLDIQIETTDLFGMAKATFVNMDSPFCAKSNTTVVQRWPTSLTSYNIPSLRTAFDKLASLPPPYDGSAFILEGYSTAAVQAVPERDTAVPDRRNTLLLSPFVIYQSSTPEVDEQGEQYGREMRDGLVSASGAALSAYVNYASGTETEAELYGSESWRREKLGRVKRAYDAENRFSFYLPIEVRDGRVPG